MVVSAAVVSASTVLVCATVLLFLYFKHSALLLDLVLCSEHHLRFPLPPVVFSCNTHLSTTTSNPHHVAVRAVNPYMVQLSTSKASSPFKCRAAFPTACTACSHHHSFSATDADFSLLISPGGMVDVSHHRLNIFEGKGEVSMNGKLDIDVASRDRADDCVLV